MRMYSSWQVLQHLILDQCLLLRPQHDTFVHFARMLACNSSLQELSLCKSGMVDSCWEVLVDCGLLQAKKLKVLRAAGNRLSPLAGEGMSHHSYATGL
jgi:hypothetical protein